MVLALFFLRLYEIKTVNVSKQTYLNNVFTEIKSKKIRKSELKNIKKREEERKKQLELEKKEKMQKLKELEDAEKEELRKMRKLEEIRKNKIQTLKELEEVDNKFPKKNNNKEIIKPLKNRWPPTLNYYIFARH